MNAKEAKARLATGSERYREAHADLDAAVRRVYPEATTIDAWGMLGWRAARPPGAPRASETGTYDMEAVVVGLAERKAGLSTYVLHPGDYYVLGKHEAALSAVGFKVMRGCLVFNRKGRYPAEAVEALLRAIRAEDEAATRGDARKAAPKRAVKRAAKKAASAPTGKASRAKGARAKRPARR